MGLHKKHREVIRTKRYERQAGEALSQTGKIDEVSTDKMAHFTNSIETYLEEHAHKCVLIDTNLRGQETYRYEPCPLPCFKYVKIAFEIGNRENDDMIKLVGFKACPRK